MMHLRQVLENGVGTAYGLYTKDEKDFFGSSVETHDAKEINIKWYKWLNKNFPDSSNFITKQKNNINSSSSHANLVYAFQNFTVHEDKKSF